MYHSFPLWLTWLLMHLKNAIIHRMWNGTLFIFALWLIQSPNKCNYECWRSKLCALWPDNGVSIYFTCDIKFVRRLNDAQMLSSHTKSTIQGTLWHTQLFFITSIALNITYIRNKIQEFHHAIESNFNAVIVCSNSNCGSSSLHGSANIQ